MSFTSLILIFTFNRKSWINNSVNFHHFPEFKILYGICTFNIRKFQWYINPSSYTKYYLCCTMNLGIVVLMGPIVYKLFLCKGKIFMLIWSIFVQDKLQIFHTLDCIFIINCKIIQVIFAKFTFQLILIKFLLVIAEIKTRRINLSFNACSLADIFKSLNILSNKTNYSAI